MRLPNQCESIKERFMKFPFAVGAAAIGIAMTAGAVHVVRADTSIPPATVPCYLNMYTCSYLDSEAYWSGCTLGYEAGVIATIFAKEICTTYHAE
jgi:hypothetical protein